MDDSFPEIHKSEGILNVKGRNKTMNIKAEQKQKVTLPSPLFRDPIYDTNGEKGLKRKLSALRTFYSYYFKKELIETNPTLLIDMPKSKC